jgi:hypothetical protein
MGPPLKSAQSTSLLQGLQHQMQHQHHQQQYELFRAQNLCQQESTAMANSSIPTSTQNFSPLAEPYRGVAGFPFPVGDVRNFSPLVSLQRFNPDLLLRQPPSGENYILFAPYKKSVC